jgi:hypothetical protein
MRTVDRDSSNVAEAARVRRLVEALGQARTDFLAALDALGPDGLRRPDLVGAWGARELIAHLGYWAGHGTEIIHAVEGGRIDEIGADEPPVDDVNATVARVARSTPLETVRRREAASFETLVERLRRVDPALLDVTLPDGASLEQGIREDGPEHYREHTTQLIEASA